MNWTVDCYEDSYHGTRWQQEVRLQLKGSRAFLSHDDPDSVSTTGRRVGVERGERAWASRSQTGQCVCFFGEETLGILYVLCRSPWWHRIGDYTSTVYCTVLYIHTQKGTRQNGTPMSGTHFSYLIEKKCEISRARPHGAAALRSSTERRDHAPAQCGHPAPHVTGGGLSGRTHLVGGKRVLLGKYGELRETDGGTGGFNSETHSTTTAHAPPRCLSVCFTAVSTNSLA